MGYVELHLHSHFSFKDSTMAVEDIVAAAVAAGMPAVALTDHSNLCGAVRFYQAARSAGIKPVVGAEIATADGHLTVLAGGGLDGYGDLCELLSRIHLDRGCTARLEDLAPYPRLTVLSGCDQGHLIKALAEGKAAAVLERHLEILGDRYHVELQHHLLPGDSQKVSRLASLAARYNVPCVATNNVHFLLPSDYVFRDVLAAMRDNRPVNGVRASLPNHEYYLKNAAAMKRLFAEYPAALTTTLDLAERCEAVIPSQLRFPRFPVPDGKTAESFLAGLCRKRLPELYPAAERAAAEERLRHELGVIHSMGFDDYFLVVWDIVEFARARGIRFAGRGSAADSIVSYLLGITRVDPIANRLLFERFLNPERRGMPDIDIDFDSYRRDEVINYVYDRHLPPLAILLRRRQHHPGRRDHAGTQGRIQGETPQSHIRVCRQIRGLPQTSLDS